MNAYPAAAGYYGQALALWPDEDEARQQLLYRHAEALYIANEEKALTALEEARDAVLALGDGETAAQAELSIARLWWHRGQRDKASAHESHAAELAGSEASPATARVIAHVARSRAIGGDSGEGLRLATEALAMAEALDIDELRAHALTTIGLGKANLGNRAGIDDYERALKIALAINSPQVGTIINNIAVSDFFAFDFVRTDELFEEGQGLAERFGDAAGVRWLRAQRAGMAFMRGRWDDGLRQLDDFIAECERGSPHYLEGRCHSDRAGIREGRGDLEGALADYERSLALARPAGDPQALLPLLASAVAAFETHGRLDAARLLAQELVDLAREHPFEAAIGLAFDFAYTRLATEFDRELREALDRAPPWPW